MDLYIHTNNINGKRYIGISNDTKRRWRGNGVEYKQNRQFYNDIQKFGWSNFVHEILLTNLSFEEAKNREIFYIALFKTSDPKYGYNKSIGGAPCNKGRDYHGVGGKEYLKEWQNRNREHISQYQHEYYLKNREQKLQYQ